MGETPIAIGVIGHGEAGSAFTADLLERGARVRVHDPAVPAQPGAIRATSVGEAVAGSDLVLVVTGAAAAEQVLEEGLACAGSDVTWADMNTGPPKLKQRLAQRAAAAGVSFADVAILASVPGKGIEAPMLASGPGAIRVRSILSAFGTPIEVQPGGAGAAAERKLLRSVFFKGLAAAVVEALEAARAAGCEEWLRHNITAELTACGPDTLVRLVDGTHRHARRRADEMAAATEMLESLGVEPAVTTASRDLLRRLRDTAPGEQPGLRP